MIHWTDYVAPYFLMGIKVIALFIAAYFAIKWHFDHDKMLKEKAKKEKAKKEDDIRELR